MVLTWCQATKTTRIGARWQCQLAASWRRVSSPGVMHTNTTTRTAFDDVYDRMSRWRRWMIRRYPTFDDVAAVIDESLWEQHVAGITDDRTMMRTAENAVRRHVRQEVRFTAVRQHLNAQLSTEVLDSVEDRVVATVDARDCLGRIEIPPRAWTWLQRHDRTGSLSPSDEIYGRRWAARTRKELASVA